MKNNRKFQYFSVGLIWIWLSLFALIPTILVLVTSLLGQTGDLELIRLQLTLDNYTQFINTVYFKIFLHSFYLAASVTVICIILGYPFAYILARMKNNYKNLLLLLVMIPFWTSSLIRTYAIVIILKTKGILNHVLLYLNLIDKPLQLLYTNTAVLIGLVYALLPFMILPLYANIEKLDLRLLDAAKDLGASRLRIIFTIILPLTYSGILAGSLLVFLPAMSMFYIPDLLGGSKSMLVGNLIENQFLAAHNWPMGSTVSIVLTLFMGLLLSAYKLNTLKNKNKQDFL